MKKFIGGSAIFGTLASLAELHRAYAMDTTVVTDSGNLVYNIGLISQQQNLISISGICGLACLFLAVVMLRPSR